MTTRADDVPAHDVPDPDHLDQLTPAVPDPGDSTDDGVLVTLPQRWDVDPTDTVEQATPVELDEDAYPHQGEVDLTDLPG
jgi:hypothetical protein